MERGREKEGCLLFLACNWETGKRGFCLFDRSIHPSPDDFLRSKSLFPTMLPILAHQEEAISTLEDHVHSHFVCQMAL